jgi:hypothetical protein
MLPAGDSWMEWTLRLVGTGIDGQSRSFDVMPISRPDGLGEIANLGLTLAEAKLPAGASSAAGRCRAGPPPRNVSAGLSVIRREVPREGLAAASDCDAVWRGQGPAGGCRLRLRRSTTHLSSRSAGTDMLLPPAGHGVSKRHTSRSKMCGTIYIVPSTGRVVRLTSGKRQA